MQYIPFCCALSCRKYRSLDTYIIPSHPVPEHINNYYIISQERPNFYTLALNLISSFLPTIPTILILVILQLQCSFK